MGYECPINKGYECRSRADMQASRKLKGVFPSKTPALHLIVFDKIVNLFSFGLIFHESVCQNEAYVPYDSDGF